MKFSLFNDNETSDPRSVAILQAKLHTVHGTADDDVETDEEVYRNAIRTCRRDIDDAVKVAKYEKDPQKYLNSFSITERVKRPWLFDRCGKYIGEPRNHTQTLHPSLNQLPSAKEPASEGKALLDLQKST